MDERFILVSSDWPSIALLDAPLAEACLAVALAATKARAYVHQNTRKTTECCHDIDTLATGASIKTFTHDHLGIRKMVQQGAAWDQAPR